MKLLRRILVSLSGPVTIVAILFGVLFMFQNKLLYFPTRTDLADYVPFGLEVWPADSEVIQLPVANQSTQTPSPAGHILGLVAEPPDEVSIQGTVILFHGNAGHAGHRSYYAQQLTALGMRTILAEYPGYGPRRGKPSEHVIVDDAVRITELAHALYDAPVWLVGESLGAGVAAAVARRVLDLVQGIVLITPWNRLADVASHHYPFLPVKWLLRSDYDNVALLALFAGPKLVVVADRDNIVPATLGVDLHQQIQEPKRLIRLANAGHNDWIVQTSPSFWSDIVQWLQESAD